MSSTAGSIQTRESSTFVLLVAIVAVVAFLGSVFNFFQLAEDNNQQTKHITTVSDIKEATLRIATYATQAASGSVEHFDKLRDTRQIIRNKMSSLSEGNPEQDMVALYNNENILQAFDRLQKKFDEINADVDTILTKSEQIQPLDETARSLNTSVSQLTGGLDEVAQVLLDINARSREVYVATSHIAIAGRLLRNLNEILQGGLNARTAADTFSRDIVILGDMLENLLNGNPDEDIREITNPEAAELLGGLFTIFTDIRGDSTFILDNSQTLADVQDAADNITYNADEMVDNASELQASYNNFVSTDRLFPSVRLGLGLIGATITLFAIVAFLAMRNRARRYRETQNLNQRNQEAILRLLDEMGSLADGDLTVTATVTEDITGAIADSINFAIEALRSLVTTINDTAVQVSAAAQETQATAMHLAEASEHQAQQITSASAAINEIAVSIDEVSKNSSESADVAQRSVSIAAKGANVVRQTIEGMDNIREQIQETSKRIKRLGESSQEIGDIVELINDIAEQTNILALNAAIQASSAGEAGRGFAVVADEVQRLAERASNATKRIETLVQTIQADTNEAVSSMEQTTSEVVSGAQLAEDAGEALGEIEKVSNDLADLIQNISEASRQQSAAATNISGTMNVIQEITTQTSAGTSQTAESIGHLADLATELRRSVADFKLPA